MRIKNNRFAGRKKLTRIPNLNTSHKTSFSIYFSIHLFFFFKFIQTFWKGWKFFRRKTKRPNFILKNSFVNVITTIHLSRFCTSSLNHNFWFLPEKLFSLNISPLLRHFFNQFIVTGASAFFLSATCWHNIRCSSIATLRFPKSALTVGLSKFEYKFLLASLNRSELGNFHSIQSMACKK